MIGSRNLVVKTGMYNGIDSVGIVGPFDSVDPQVDAIVEAIIKQGKKNIVFDFSETSYLTSSGIAVLIKVLKKCQKVGGNLYIANITQDMYDLLHCSSLSTFLQFV
jgi:anti-anti-sigma factor